MRLCASDVHFPAGNVPYVVVAGTYQRQVLQLLSIIASLYLPLDLMRPLLRCTQAMLCISNLLVAMSLHTPTTA